MHWVEIIAEDRIQEAIKNGEFTNLPGKGKPLDLSEYFKTPAADRVGNSILKNANFVPPEVELLQEIQKLEKLLAGCREPAQQRQLLDKIQLRRVSYTMLMERRRSARIGV